MSKMFKTKKASILGATLIILGIVLVSALSFSLVTIQERKASTGANRSSQALQTAGTGVEKVMQDILKSGKMLTSELSGCGADGLVRGTGYEIELKDKDGNKIACNIGTDLADVKSMKSVGSTGENQRAVEVAVAAGDCKGGITKVISNSSNKHITNAQIQELMDFLDDGNGKAAQFFCKNSSSKAESLNIGRLNIATHVLAGGTYFDVSIDGVRVCTPDPFVTDGCTSILYGDCNQGWSFYGSCTCDNTCSI